MDARRIVHTEQGIKWLSQFSEIDQEVAKSMANLLTLVSHNEFRRNIENLIHEVSSQVLGTVGLFAVRELKKKENSPSYSSDMIPFYQQVSISPDGKSVSALSDSSDQGSEAIISQVIRQICKANSEKFLNHPSLSEMRSRRCDSLIFVDDFIGSGKRTKEFISAFWAEKTIVSWLSSKHINIKVISYSGTEYGISRLKGHPSKPEVSIYRDAPTYRSLPISQKKKQEIFDLCEVYGRKKLKKRRNFWFGYNRGMVSLVFEHGCPNNAPAILWDPDDKNKEWIGLFPNRTVESTTASVFPPEIVRSNPIETLNNIGQKRLATSGALLRRGEAGSMVLLILALIAKGQRRRSGLCYATGLNSKEYEKMISKCIKWQFLTPERRITPRGLAELNAARRMRTIIKRDLDAGSDYYYPQTLRAATTD